MVRRQKPPLLVGKSGGEAGETRYLVGAALRFYHVVAARSRKASHDRVNLCSGGAAKRLVVALGTALGLLGVYAFDGFARE